MTARKTPMRKCMGCMQMFPKKDLVRVVRTKTGDGENDYEISLDLTGKKAGRGAYICKNLPCLQAARKKGRISRALDCAIPDTVYDTLEQEMIQSDG